MSWVEAMSFMVGMLALLSSLQSCVDSKLGSKFGFLIALVIVLSFSRATDHLFAIEFLRLELQVSFIIERWKIVF